MRGATRVERLHAGRGGISIHAPHARSDVLAERAELLLAISIHAPHARSDATVARSFSPSRNFNPRSSCEERPMVAFMHRHLTDFNPRSSCEERLEGKGISSHLRAISIHAPHARSDMRDAPSFVGVEISIHAPHARSDSKAKFLLNHLLISIHAPHARSDAASESWRAVPMPFQSTLLMRGAT